MADVGDASASNAEQLEANRVAAAPNPEPTASPNTEQPIDPTADDPTTAADTTTPADTRMTADQTVNAPPRFTWARPSLQKYSCTINHYVKDEVVAKVQRILRVKGGNAAVESFRKGPFGHFLDLKIGSSANNALHELMCHEMEDNTDEASEFVKWFRIGKTNLPFSAPDYALVTGLRFGSKNCVL